MAENGSQSSNWSLASLGTGGPLVFVAALLALLRVYAPPQSEPAKGETSKAPSTAEASRPSTDSKDGALKPLVDFLCINHPDLPADQSACLDQLPRDYSIEVLIATLPDPKRSRVASMFDTMLEAIRRAVEAEGYVLDQSNLPWAESESAETTTVTALPGRRLDSWRVTIERKEDPSKTVRARQPGSILFRNVPKDQPSADGCKPPRLLLLLLVGETPTDGIDKDALWTALNIAKHLASYREDPCRAWSVIGPTFSGSAESLALTLSRWYKYQNKKCPVPDLPEVWVCTGSATGLDKTRFECLARPARTRLAATVIPDRIMFDQVIDWFKKRDSYLSSETVARLIEGSTEYSAGIRRESKRLDIPFPIHISQIRGAKGGEQRDPIVAQQRGHVPIPIDDVPEAKDQLQSLTPKMTTASDSLIMSNILATIAREEVRYVGIFATDVLDVLFLTGLIRQYCPDVQIILMGGDLRYTDPEFTFDFRGAIVASSYPLDPLHQLWSYPMRGDRSRRLFVTDSDMGCYNATLVLLKAEPNGPYQLNGTTNQLSVRSCGHDYFLAYGPPTFGPLLTEKEARPAIWINQVGQCNLWALKAISIEELDKAKFGKDADGAKAAELIPAIVGPKLPCCVPMIHNRPNWSALNLPMHFKLVAFGLFVLVLVLGVSCVRPPPEGEARWLGRFARPWARAYRDKCPAARWCIVLIAGAIAVPSGLMLRAAIMLDQAHVLQEIHHWDLCVNRGIMFLLWLNILAMLLVILFAPSRLLAVPIGTRVVPPIGV